MMACGEDRTAPGSEADPTGDPAPAAPADTTSTDTTSTDTLGSAPGDTTAGDTLAPAPGVDSTVGALAVLDNRSSAPGIVFGSYGLDASQLNSLWTGTLRGGGIDGANVLALLSAARAKGARVVLKMCNGRDSFVQNPDGTFSLTKWKALVDRFRSANLSPYINDGTLVGHFLIDEPQRAAKWGGKIIPQSTVEDMARYSKQIWPTLTTFVRSQPTWLASSAMSYTYLDAGWAQFAGGKGDASSWVAAEVAAAKQKGLGLAVGLNALSGGDGSSRIPGWKKGDWAMSASEITKHGTALLNQSYACAFYVWTYDGPYYGRSDIKNAFAALSSKAKAHVKTSCRQ